MRTIPYCYFLTFASFILLRIVVITCFKRQGMNNFLIKRYSYTRTNAQYTVYTCTRRLTRKQKIYTYIKILIDECFFLLHSWQHSNNSHNSNNNTNDNNNSNDNNDNMYISIIVLLRCHNFWKANWRHSKLHKTW